MLLCSVRDAVQSGTNSRSPAGKYPPKYYKYYPKPQDGNICTNRGKKLKSSEVFPHY